MSKSQYFTDIAFAPLIAGEWIFVLSALLIALLIFSIWQGLKGAAFRGAFFAALIALLLNPQLVEERRSYLNDTVLIIEDTSNSQKIGERMAQTKQARKDLEAKLSNFENLNVQTLSVTEEKNLLNKSDSGTKLFQSRAEFLSSFPSNRLAATILLTDGQVHDVPTNLAGTHDRSPIHVLLSGTQNEIDRVLFIEKSPSFGIVGKNISFDFKVSDFGVPNAPKTVVVTVKLDGEIIKRQAARVGISETVTLEVPHGGQNHVVLEVEPLANELSEKNNIAVFSVNGVRDRLKVLLVSGEPHMGERSWRNILKADPSVELIHFTILRPPEKQDGTPLKELSLIPFPIVELFEQKLEEFDLIIFDRYRRRGVLSSRYLTNIVNYVENGGALLEAAGPSFATPLSLFRTPLSVVLPGKPTGTVFEEPYVPAISKQGNRHPVTATLKKKSAAKDWGRWFRLVDTDVNAGDILMTGPTEKPLLVLHRQGEGRVAQLMSDHAWLWGRGFEGGGPQSELFRRIAHWLMKEPELEEESLNAQILGSNLQIIRQSLDLPDNKVQVTLPSGESVEIELEATSNGQFVGTTPLNGRGLYRLQATGASGMIAVGALSPLEERDVRATEEKLESVRDVTGGGLHWISEGQLPDFKRTTPDGRQASDLWWGLVANEQYEITGYSKRTMLPEILALILLLGALSISWWRESR
jgi:hypothetical protein